MSYFVMMLVKNITNIYFKMMSIELKTQRHLSVRLTFCLIKLRRTKKACPSFVFDEVFSVLRSDKIRLRNKCVGAKMSS